MEPDFNLEKLLYALGLAAVIAATATRVHADMVVSKAPAQNVSHLLANPPR